MKLKQISEASWGFPCLKLISTCSQATGIKPEGLEDVDLDADFDPEEYDQHMATKFGGEYYDEEDEGDAENFLKEVRQEIEEGGYEAEVGWGADGEEADHDWDHWKDGDEQQGEAEDEAEVEVGAEDVAEDAEGQEEAEDWDVGGEKRSREHRRKHGGKKVDLGEYLDEYYKLDYEDIVGGIATRFKYKQVAPVDFGMDPVEILLMDDKDLNQFAGLKKYAAYREDEQKLPKQYTKRRWDYFKKNKGWDKTLQEKYEDLGQRSGPDNQKKKEKQSKSENAKKSKRRERDGSKRKREDEASSNRQAVKKDKKQTGSKTKATTAEHNEKSKAKPNTTGISNERFATYTNSTKRTKKSKTE